MQYFTKAAGDSLPGYPDQFALPRILTREEVERASNAAMPPLLASCLAHNLAVVRASRG